MPLICYVIVTTGKPAKAYSRPMRVETAQPLFSYLDGGLFIHQANALVVRYDLRHWWHSPPGGLILGPQSARLDKRQILRLLTLAVSRLTGDAPHFPAGQDFRVHGTIASLYGGFCKSFLEKLPHQPEDHTLLLKSFLDRLVEIYLGQPPTIEYSALNRERWKFLIDAGQRLLEYQFPAVPRDRAFPAPPARGCESDLTRLEEAADRLRFEVARLSNLSRFRAAEHPGRRSRLGRATARRALCRQFEPEW
jgi:hypothetical protein